MKIKLEQVMPFPLKDQDTSSSQVWGTVQEFEGKEFVQVQAPSGKGKSTFIQLVYGNRKDYTGTAYFDGTPISKLSGKQVSVIRQQRLSIVFQDLRLFPDFTGWENLLLKLRLTDFYSQAEVEAMTSRLGVSHLLKKPCGLMSFGERQRYAIIRSLLQPFEMLLLDEPFSHLDARNSRLAAELISEECAKRNAGMLVAGLDADDFFNYTRTVLL